MQDPELREAPEKQLEQLFAKGPIQVKHVESQFKQEEFVVFKYWFELQLLRQVEYP